MVKSMLIEAPYGRLAPAAIYWGARSHQEGGFHEQGQKELAALIERFPVGYYAYRAAQRLGTTWPEPQGALPDPAADPRVAQVNALVAAGMFHAARQALYETARGELSLAARDLYRLAAVARKLEMAGRLRFSTGTRPHRRPFAS